MRQFSRPSTMAMQASQSGQGGFQGYPVTSRPQSAVSGSSSSTMWQSSSKPSSLRPGTPIAPGATLGGSVLVLTLKDGSAAADDVFMVIDIVMGATSALIGLWLAVCSGPLADHLQEGDERVRERHPWAESFEPQAGFLATADGRWWILRGWLLACSAAFAGIGAALVLRTLL